MTVDSRGALGPASELEVSLEFLEHTRNRIGCVLERLQTKGCNNCRHCAETLDELLQAVAAECYFFGFLRSHEIVRVARSALALEPGARCAVWKPLIAEAISLLIELQEEIDGIAAGLAKR